MKDGYPNNYFDENWDFSYPWQKDIGPKLVNISTCLDCGNTWSPVEVTKFSCKCGSYNVQYQSYENQTPVFSR